MIPTHGLCAGRGIGFSLAVGNTAVGVLHAMILLKSRSMPVAIRDLQALGDPGVCHDFLFVSVDYP